MSAHNKLRKHLYSSVGPALLVAMSLATSDSGQARAVCQGPGAPNNTQTKCLTAVAIPAASANKTGGLQSFDISWVNPDRAEYYLGDRANAGITIVDTKNLTFKRTIGGFVGVVLNGTGTAVDNNHSGPDGVESHDRWLYAGDGDSTLKVIDLNNTMKPIQQTINTGGTTRVDEMALTTNGKLLLAANNAEDPPFATLFNANGDAATSHVTIITRIMVDSTIVPTGFGLSLEQTAWDPKTERFYTSMPIIANNPPGCNYGQLPNPATPGPITCEGGMLVTDPAHPKTVEGAFDPTTNTGVVPLHACGPNGATLGPHDNLMLGCTPGNVPDNTTTLVINAKTKNYANIGGITGSDEVWFNRGDRRYYLGASKMTKPAGSPLGSGAVLGVVDGTSVLIESIPQSSNSHSVAADSKRNRIFVPQVQCCGPTNVIGGDTNTTQGAGSQTVGQLLCGSSNGCIAVYQHDVDDDDHDHDGDDDHDKRADNH